MVFFSGNSLSANGIYEEALEGYDLEVGTRLPLGAYLSRFEPKLYLKYFDFSGDVLREDNDGFALRLSARPQQNITLDLSWEDDNMMGNKASFTFTYSFTGKTVTRARTLRERMTEFHQRDIDVRETSQLSNELRTSTLASDRVLVSDQVVHVDNAQGAGGDGSFETPYNSINSCVSGSCGSSEIIYVHAGAANYTTPITLANSQKLIGQGSKFYGLGGDAYPVLEAASNVLVMANDNEVAGMSIRATAGNAVVGVDNSGAISIHNNKLWARGGNTLNLTVNSSATIERNISINDNSIDSDQLGINIDSTITGGASLTQSLSIASNTITSQGNGIDIDTAATTASQLLENLSITNNTVTASGSGSRAVSLDLTTDDAGTNAVRSVTASGNQLTAVDGYGFEYYSVEAQSGSRITESFAFTNNQVTSKEQALYLNWTRAIDAGSQVDRNVHIEGNNLTATNDRGIQFWESEPENGGILNLDVNIIDNQITSLLEGVHFFNQDVENASTYNRTIKITGNTIDSKDNAIEFTNYTAQSGSTFNDDISIQNNNITATGTGIYLIEATADGSGSSLNRKVLIEGNTIQGATKDVDVIAVQAINQASKKDDLVIKNN